MADIGWARNRYYADESIYVETPSISDKVSHKKPLCILFNEDKFSYIENSKCVTA